jgi:hypothetical protein
MNSLLWAWPIFAVTRHAPPRGGAVWYFAGDFVGHVAVRHLVEGLKLAPWETAFYWRFYVPMMESILNDAGVSR